MNTFTTENQKENNISRTTSQTVKHCIYSNIEVTISGWFNKTSDCKVWKRQGKKISMIAEGLELNEAILISNNIITQ
jgi:hypothetical protein